jgi:YggT family protein
MSDYLLSPVAFVLTVLFQFYILAVLLRLLLQWVRADFYNPLSQAIVKLTNPPLRPLRRLIPGYGGIDLAALLLAFVLELVKAWLVGAEIGRYHMPGLIEGGSLSPLQLIDLALAELVALTFNIYIFSIIIQALLSWVNPGHYNPFSALLSRLNEPLLRPARRLIPPFSGLDLSPLVVILALQVVKMLVMPLFLLALR